MGAGRVVFALGGADHAERRQNVRTVLQQETRSYLRALEPFSSFTHLILLKPSGTYVTQQRSDYETQFGRQGPRGEGATLEAMARLIGARLGRVS